MIIEFLSPPTVPGFSADLYPSNQAFMAAVCVFAACHIATASQSNCHQLLPILPLRVPSLGWLPLVAAPAGGRTPPPPGSFNSASSHSPSTAIALPFSIPVGHPTAKWAASKIRSITLVFLHFPFASLSNQLIAVSLLSKRGSVSVTVRGEASNFDYLMGLDYGKDVISPIPDAS